MLLPCFYDKNNYEKSRIRKLLCKFAVESWLLCRYDYFYFSCGFCYHSRHFKHRKCWFVMGQRAFRYVMCWSVWMGRMWDLLHGKESLTYLIRSKQPPLRRKAMHQRSYFGVRFCVILSPFPCRTLFGWGGGNRKAGVDGRELLKKMPKRDILEKTPVWWTWWFRFRSYTWQTIP